MCDYLGLYTFIVLVMHMYTHTYIYDVLQCILMYYTSNKPGPSMLVCSRTDWASARNQCFLEMGSRKGYEGQSQGILNHEVHISMSPEFPSGVLTINHGTRTARGFKDAKHYHNCTLSMLSFCFHGLLYLLQGFAA